MSKRSFRTSPEYERQEAAIFAHYGITGETQKELYEKLAAILHEKIEATKNGTIKDETFTDDTIDCVHLVTYQTGTEKVRTHHLCVWRPPSIDIELKNPANGKTYVICKGSPVKIKTLPSLKVCHHCQIQCPTQQAYREALKEADEEEEEIEMPTAPTVEAPITFQPVPEISPEQNFVIPPNWVPMLNTSNMRLCPFTLAFIANRFCQNVCKRDEPKKFNVCCEAHRLKQNAAIKGKS